MSEQKRQAEKDRGEAICFCCAATVQEMVVTHDGVLSQTGCPTADVVGDPVVRKAYRCADLHGIGAPVTLQSIVKTSVTVSLGE